MPGSQADELDWENMTNKELHDKFQEMLGQQVEDVMASFRKALARIDDIEKAIDNKLDAILSEVLARLPPPTTSTAPLQQQQQPPPTTSTAPLQQQQQPPPRGQVDRAPVWSITSRCWFRDC